MANGLGERTEKDGEIIEFLRHPFRSLQLLPGTVTSGGGGGCRREKSH